MKPYIIYIIMFMMSVTTMAQTQAYSARTDTVQTDSLLTDSTLINTEVPLTLRQQIDSLLKDDMFQTSVVGIKIYDLTGDSLVYSYNDRQTLRPASTMKCFTAITALDKLGGSYRFATTLKCNGTILERRDTIGRKYNILVGNIIVRGGMDPRFGSDDMKSFVEAIIKEKIDTIYGSIVADLSFKDEKRLGSGWCWDDRNPCLTPLLWNKKDTFIETLLDRVIKSGIVVLPSSQLHCDSAFMAEVLQGRRVDSLILDIRYHSIDQIMMPMMKNSDNLYAECLFYQIAASTGIRYASANIATDIMRSLVTRLGFNPESYNLADGSGLSLYNYLSPELELALLKYAYENSNIYTHLLPTLPVAGEDGTLKKRMRNADCRGHISAKTGTAEGVSTLAGYVFCESGSTLCFSIMNQGIRRTVSGCNFQDKLCQIMYHYK